MLRGKVQSHGIIPHGRHHALIHDNNYFNMLNHMMDVCCAVGKLTANVVTPATPTPAAMIQLSDPVPPPPPPPP